MNRKNLLFYVGVLVLFGAGIQLLLTCGSRLNAGQPLSDQPSEARTLTLPSQPGHPPGPANNAASALRDHMQGPLSILLLQIILIVALAKIVGSFFLKIGQDAVVGEMIAGILLGPSVLGLISPAALAFLFPASSMDGLRSLSQIGVILFMFIVGLELNARHLRERMHAAVIVSHASIIIPFFLGIMLALFIYQSPTPLNTSFNAFALFIGTAMSITAFPVLARIIKARGMSDSYLGNLAIACAAVDDVTAWCILAVVITIVKADSMGNALLTIALVVAFIGSMIFLLKPPLARILGNGRGGKVQDKGIMAGVLVLVLASAWLTEVIGIHALFGAFMAGVIMPPLPEFRSHLKSKLEPFSSSFLLPLFFASTGLRTQINLLDDWQSWALCAGTIAVAIAGKLGGSMLAARWTGINWRDSFCLGVLMNTRGLVELVVLNIGYDLGILPGRIFTIMVLMALVTTSMTGPILALIRVGAEKRSVATYGLGSVN